MAKTKSVFETYDYKKTYEYQLHLKVLDCVAKMTTEEKVQSLIDAGIITKDCKLSARHGGPGEITED